jgi:hypothetical protein
MSAGSNVKLIARGTDDLTRRWQALTVLFALPSDSAEANFNKLPLQRCSGGLEAGWPDYERRWKPKVLSYLSEISPSSVFNLLFRWVRIKRVLKAFPKPTVNVNPVALVMAM